MSTVNHLRKQGQYFKAMSAIVAEVNHSSMSFPTVTSVELTRDGSHLYVYMNFESNPNKSIEAINSAKGFVRSQLASYSTQRIVPQLHFRLDTSQAEGNRVDQILREIKEKESKK